MVGDESWMIDVTRPVKRSKPVSGILQFQVLPLDPDCMFRRFFANHMANINSRQREWHLFKGFHGGNYE